MAETKGSNGERIRVAVADGVVAGWRWPADRPPLLFCHANGFCASAYKSMLTRLAGRFDICAIDLRGHGRTDLRADPGALKSWRVFSDDIGATLDRLGGGPWRLAGHSCGAVAATIAAVGRSDIARIALIEPVAPPAVFNAFAATPLWPLIAARMPLVNGALARRAEWSDRRAVFDAYARKRIFASCAEGLLTDYLEDGLVETADGVALACRPEWEAAIFAAQANGFWRALKAAPAPVFVLAADDRSSTVNRGARTRLRQMGAEVATLTGVSHLLPMENPGAAADFLSQALLR